MAREGEWYIDDASPKWARQWDGHSYTSRKTVASLRASGQVVRGSAGAPVAGKSSGRGSDRSGTLGCLVLAVVAVAIVVGVVLLVHGCTQAATDSAAKARADAPKPPAGFHYVGDDFHLAYAQSSADNGCGTAGIIACNHIDVVAMRPCSNPIIEGNVTDLDGNVQRSTTGSTHKLKAGDIATVDMGYTSFDQEVKITSMHCD